MSRALAGSVLATFAVGVLLLVPVPRLPGGLEPLAASSWADKAVHLALFFALGLAWIRALGPAGTDRWGRTLALVAGLTAYGGLLEIAQSATGYRTASFGDLAADGAGAAVALALARLRAHPARTDPR